MLSRSRGAVYRWGPVAVGMVAIVVQVPSRLEDAGVGSDAALTATAVVTAALATWVAFSSHRIGRRIRRWEMADRTPRARALPPGGEPGVSSATLWDARDDPRLLEAVEALLPAARTRSLSGAEFRSGIGWGMVRDAVLMALAFLAVLFGALFAWSGRAEIIDGSAASVALAAAVLVVVGATFIGSASARLLHGQRMANLTEIEYEAWVARQRRLGMEAQPDRPLPSSAARTGLGVVLAVLVLILGWRVSTAPAESVIIAAVICLACLAGAIVAIWRARRPHVIGLRVDTGTVLDFPDHLVEVRRDGERLVLAPRSSGVEAASFALADVLAVETSRRPTYFGLPRPVFLLLRDDVVVLRGAGVADDPALAGLSGVVEPG